MWDCQRETLIGNNPPPPGKVPTVAGIAPSPKLSPTTLLSLSVFMGLWAAAAVTPGLDPWVPVGTRSLVFHFAYPSVVCLSLE